MRPLRYGRGDKKDGIAVLGFLKGLDFSATVEMTGYSLGAYQKIQLSHKRGNKKDGIAVLGFLKG